VKRIKKDDIDGIPPDGYICRVCHIAGHYVHKCPENTKSVPDGYICRICGIPGHYSMIAPSIFESNFVVRDCPKAEERTVTSKALKKRDLSLCWFCLSNPNVESHMILGIVNDCYVALAKGSLTEEHILIVPILHHANMSTLLKSEIDQDGEESVTKEIHDIYKKVSLILINSNDRFDLSRKKREMQLFILKYSEAVIHLIHLFDFTTCTSI
jgi:hypothetical protein